MHEVPETGFTRYVGRHRESAKRSRAVADMTPEEIARMAAGRMAPAHDHLDTLLDEE